jgi:cardiolipin synthase A/B
MARPDPSLQHGHLLQLLEGSREFFPALVAAMDAAREEIRLETYIFDVTGEGAVVADALIRAAHRGVATFLVVDGVGTPGLPAPWPEQLDAAGVHWRIFSPLGALGLLIPSRWRRLHRKLCVVDGSVAFCGGINILDDLHDPNHGLLAAPRFDFAVRASGALVDETREATQQLWLRMQAVSSMKQRQLAAALTAFRSAGVARPAGHRPGGLAGSGDDRGTARAALLLRDNLRNRGQIEKAYRRAIGAARHDILIANAYFLPGRKLRKALMVAAARGVRVRLLLQGRYEYFMQYHAARPVYGALLAAGVEIYEYSTSFLHAKVAVIDTRWATVGSSNLDPLSLLLAREANVVVEDVPFATALQSRLVRAIDEESQPVDASAYAQRPWGQRVRDRIAFGLMRAALFVTGHRY